MSEQRIPTHIDDGLGGEIPVTICFDYTPAQNQTHDDPAWPSEVIINGVLVNGDDKLNIVWVIKELEFSAIEQTCLESMENCDER